MPAIPHKKRLCTLLPPPLPSDFLRHGWLSSWSCSTRDEGAWRLEDLLVPTGRCKSRKRKKHLFLLYIYFLIFLLLNCFYFLNCFFIFNLFWEEWVGWTERSKRSKRDRQNFRQFPLGYPKGQREGVGRNNYQAGTSKTYRFTHMVRDMCMVEGCSREGVFFFFKSYYLYRWHGVVCVWPWSSMRNCNTVQ